MRARIALAASLALMLSACSFSPKVPLSRLSGWHVAEAGNTRLISDLAADDLRDLAGDLVRFDAIFAKRAGWPVAPLTTPLTIFVFRNNEIGALFGLRGIVGGWANPALDASYITVDASAGQDSSHFTLLHEYTHLLLRRNRRAPLPRWFDEGLATYFSHRLVDQLVSRNNQLLDYPRGLTWLPNI